MKKTFITDLTAFIILLLMAAVATADDTSTQEISIPLHVGYNQVGFCVKVSNDSSAYPASIFVNVLSTQGINASEVRQWTGSGWNVYTQGDTGTDFVLDSAKGIFIKAESDKYNAGDWTQSGAPVMLPLNISLMEGWNSVAMPASAGYKTAFSIINDIMGQGGTAEVIMWWDGGQWISTDKDVFVSDQVIVPGRSYLIKCASSCVWEIKKQDTTPPAKPTVNSVKSPTAETDVTFSGKKETCTSVIVNGVEKVPANAALIWAACITLNEGNNQISVTSKDLSGNESQATFVNVLLDTTPPVLPLVQDDGVTTNNPAELNAAWVSSDDETGIAESFYAIGTAQGSSDIVYWTKCGPGTGITASGLSLVSGHTYYISVKTRNNVGLWSAIGSSDGITVSQTAPIISNAVPLDGGMSAIGDVIKISITANDIENDAIFYKILVDGETVKDWGAETEFDWQTFDRTTGLHTVTVKAKDVWGNESEKSIEVFFVRGTPALPVKND